MNRRQRRLETRPTTRTTGNDRRGDDRSLDRLFASVTSMVAYGARCTWWDSKAKVGKLASGLPCCPHCNGVLFEAPEDQFVNVPASFTPPASWGISRHEYPIWLKWARGRCYPTHADSIAAWRSEVTP